MSQETRRSLKPDMGRLGIVYVRFKVHKDSVDNCLLFQSILFAINTPTYKLAKFLLLI